VTKLKEFLTKIKYYLTKKKINSRIKKFDNDLTMKHTFDKNKVIFTKKEIFLVVINSLFHIQIIYESKSIYTVCIIVKIYNMFMF
jgi:hypothetical protein